MLAAHRLVHANATISDDANLLADPYGRRVPCRVRDRARRRGRHFWRRRDLPVSDLREMGRRIQKGDRCRGHLSADRLGRRHQADPGQGGDLRRLRHAAQWRGPGTARSGAIPDRRRRHRGRGEYRRRQDRRPHPGRSDPGQDLPRRDQVVERRGAAQAQSEREASVAGDHRGASLRRFRHDLRLHGLPLQGERDLENAGRIDHLHRLAGRNRSRGQRGRCRHRCPHQGIDRICRIRLCHAEQAHRDQAR